MIIIDPSKIPGSREWIIEALSNGHWVTIFRSPKDRSTCCGVELDEMWRPGDDGCAELDHAKCDTLEKMEASSLVGAFESFIVWNAEEREKVWKLVKRRKSDLKEQYDKKLREVATQYAEELKKSAVKISSAWDGELRAMVHVHFDAKGGELWRTIERKNPLRGGDAAAGGCLIVALVTALVGVLCYIGSWADESAHQASDDNPWHTLAFVALFGILFLLLLASKAFRTVVIGVTALAIVDRLVSRKKKGRD